MTPASDAHPTIRRVEAERRDRTDVLVVEIGATHVTLRPARARRGGDAEVAISWAKLYDHCVLARAGLGSAARPRRAR